jgi:parallel beta-helix repeat protein
MGKIVNSILIVLIATMSMILVIDITPNVKSGTPPPPDDGIDGLQYIDGDWDVSGTENYTDEIIVLTGNLTVLSGGNLTFNNVTLMMNCTNYDGEYEIEVLGGGSFQILGNSNVTDSTFDVDDGGALDYEYLFWVRDTANFTMKDSEVHECGWNGSYKGLTIETDDTIIENSLFSNNYCGIYFYQSSNNLISNVTAKENGREGIYLHYSYNNDIINTNVSSNEDTGIFIDYCDNNVLVNITGIDNWAGVYLFWADYNTVKNSTFLHNSNYGVGMQISTNNEILNTTCFYSDDGIELWLGSNNNLVDNCNTSYNVNGIYIAASQHNIITNNTGYHNFQEGLRVRGSVSGGKEDFNQTIPTNNIVNGKPVYYFFDRKNESFEGLDAGHIIYAWCDNVSLKNSKTSGGGLRFDLCSNSTATNYTGFGLAYGAVVAYSWNISFLNCNLTSNIFTGFLTGSSTNITIINSTIEDSGFLAEIALSSNAHLTLLNTTFDSDKIMIDDALSTLIVQWYLNVRTVDYNYTPIKDANILVKNVTDDTTFVGTTDSNGYIKWIVITEFWQNKSIKMMYTPHNITGSKDFNSSTAITTMNRSKEIILLLEKYQQKLPYGWNLLSLPVVQENNSVEKVLESLEGNYNAIQHYSRGELEYTDNYNENVGRVIDYHNSQKNDGEYASLLEDLGGSTFTPPVPENFSIDLSLFYVEGYLFASYVPITMETDITWIDLFFGEDGTSQNLCKLAIYDDDGPNGAPGTLLSWTDTFRPNVQNDYAGAEVIGGAKHFLPGSYWFSFIYQGYADFNITLDDYVNNTPNADPVNNNGSYYKIFEPWALPWPDFPSTFPFDKQIETSAGLFRAINGSYKLDIELDISDVREATSYTLELSYKTNGEKFDVLVYDGSTWNDRGDLDSSATTFWSYNLTSQEYNNGLIRIRFMGQNETYDMVKNKLYLHYLRVCTERIDVWWHYTTFKIVGNTLSKLDHTIGFWVFITNLSGATFSPNGFVPLSEEIRLHPGWNQVGYPSSTSYNRTDGLNNLIFNKDVNSILTYDSLTQNWVVIGESDYFETGRGYWIHSVGEKTWKIPV